MKELHRCRNIPLVCVSSSAPWPGGDGRRCRSRGCAAANPDGSVNPTASSVKEDQLLNELNRISGRCTIPDQKACTIEQLAGRDWRHFHEVTLRWIGAISIRLRCSFSSI
jgi:hypothetical protein